MKIENNRISTNMQNHNMTEFKSHIMHKRVSFPFDNSEKLIMIELNPYAVEPNYISFYNKLEGFTFRYLDQNLGTCLELKYSRNWFIMDCCGKKQAENDQRLIITLDKTSGNIIDVQGVWIYLNKQRLILNIGYGEPRLETTLKKYDMSLFKDAIQRISSIVVFQEGIDSDILKILQTKKSGLPKPIRINTKDFYVEQISEVIAQNFATILLLHSGVKAQQLSKEINDLYQAAHQIKLHELVHMEKSSFKFRLGELIHHSITIEGCFLNKILRNKQEKIKLQGLDPFMTYLRVGLGQSNIFSAGHQFVLEIWPFKHYSSVHNHAGQYGIVKILQGTISVSIYAILSNAPHLKDPIKELICNKNDITWLAPRVNQVHQLTNFFPQTAITLQCYKYCEVKQDKQNVFNYVANNKYLHFTPQSDLADLELKEVLNQLILEYRNHYKQN